jgi:hypothetical protein
VSGLDEGVAKAQFPDELDASFGGWLVTGNWGKEDVENKEVEEALAYSISLSR